MSSQNQNQESHQTSWESSANDRLWDDAAASAANLMETSTTSTTAFLNGDTNNNNHDASSSSSSCSSQCFRACHALDILAGTALCLYVGLVLWGKEGTNATKTTTIATLSIGCVWIIRGVLAKVTPCGVSVSATLSFWFCVLYLVLAVCLWIWALLAEPGTICPVIGTAKSNSNRCFHLSASQLAGVLVGVAIIEGIRFIWIRNWMMMEAEDAMIQSEIQGNRQTGSQQQQQQQPWWWWRNSGRQSSLSSPLLNTTRTSNNYRPHWSTRTTSNNGRDQDYDYRRESGTRNNNTASNTATGSYWWPFFSRRRIPSRDLRDDDGSVDYASLNEDWASRSQEDPFWWTEDAAGNAGAGGMGLPAQQPSRI